MPHTIYIAENVKTNDQYIGITSQRLNDRRLKHYSDATNGARGCRRFAAAIRKYGRDGFRWIIYTEGVDDGDLAFAIEHELIAKNRPAYNILPGGRGFIKGAPKTAEHIEKIASKLRGKKRTPEQIARFREVRSSPEYRAKMSAALKGRRHSPERIAAIVAGRNKKRPEGHE